MFTINKKHLANGIPPSKWKPHAYGNEASGFANIDKVIYLFHWVVNPLVARVSSWSLLAPVRVEYQVCWPRCHDVQWEDDATCKVLGWDAAALPPFQHGDMNEIGSIWAWNGVNPSFMATLENNKQIRSSFPSRKVFKTKGISYLLNEACSLNFDLQEWSGVTPEQTEPTYGPQGS